MSEMTKEISADDEAVPFAWVDHYLKPIGKLAAWVRGRPSEHVELAFWILTLLGILPALRADLLFPFDWMQNFESNFTFSWIENPFWFFSLLPAFLLFVIAVAQRSRIRYQNG